MQLSPEHQQWLSRAMEYLASGDHRRFEDLMWLGFGDGWRPMMGVLARSGYVKIGGVDRLTPAMPDRGHGLLERLRIAMVEEAS